MILDPNDIRIETMRGTGEGGQNKNKRETAVRVTHLPTGIQAYVDGRHQGQNKKKALAELSRRVAALSEGRRAAARKERRDAAIHDRNIVRTYDFKRGVAVDHRTKRSASIKNVMEKGRFDLIAPRPGYDPDSRT